MLYFCTLFNATYLTRGVAMYESLKKHCPHFHLYIYAFDTHSYEVLERLNLSQATIIGLDEWEDEQLLQLKSSRTAGEYCWTCTPATIWHTIQAYQLPHCTYIDADLLFFSNPDVLIKEMGEASVLITPHRYTPAYDQTETSGKYCVQFVTFKRDARGLEALAWWKKACIDWCYNRFEDGKFGDQKYLDDWLDRFSGVHELQHLGGGVAPWNVQQYAFMKSEPQLQGKDLFTDESFEVVFYHFHSFSYSRSNILRLCNPSYMLPDSAIKHLYAPYIRALQQSYEAIRQVNQAATSHEIANNVSWLGRSWKKTILFWIKGHYANHYHQFRFRHGLIIGR
ncbi:glycosyl transferase [Siphonobacter curvatus]|nr:glycosyl transferase [Siphonobacter curvatus]